ncbi:molybdenum cofactor guanylyltransferase [Microbulbifer epialgicus]|uniref:Molybdenum cofactor guanylyltransferase n=1 Tax=Microbulbifer epialgicus TaxID=393907 RepID=A0ABV4P4C2_9GAMM
MGSVVSNSKTLGIVLAGGRSSRMGRDKALLAHPENGNFLENARALLSELPLQQVVVSGARDGGIPDLVADMGPLGGLHSVALRTGAAAALVIPVDMPLLKCDALAELLAEGQRRQHPCYFDNFFFPLWLPFNDACLDYLQRAVKGAVRNSVSALLSHLCAQSISTKHAGDWHRNINTPADYLGLTTLDKIPENNLLREH